MKEVKTVALKHTLLRRQKIDQELPQISGHAELRRIRLRNPGR